MLNSAASYLIISPLEYKYPLYRVSQYTFSPRSIMLFITTCPETVGATARMSEFNGIAPRT